MQNEKHRCSDKLFRFFLLFLFWFFFFTLKELKHVLPSVDICDPKTRFQNKDKQKPALIVFVEDYNFNP